MRRKTDAIHQTTVAHGIGRKFDLVRRSTIRFDGFERKTALSGTGPALFGGGGQCHETRLPKNSSDYLFSAPPTSPSICEMTRNKSKWVRHMTERGVYESFSEALDGVMRRVTGR
jgi:hypothetical protein